MPMSRRFVLPLLLAAGSCAEITAADASPVQVILTPKAGSAACVVANPEPAAVKAKQGISFVNRSTVQITLVLLEDDLPLVSVPPNSVSGAIQFRSPGIHEYYSQGCGSGPGERHTLSVTVN